MTPLPVMSQPLLSVEKLVAGYMPEAPIVRGLSLHVMPREMVTILGPNGAGKSTLIKAINGLVRVASGRVMLAGTDITHTPAHGMIALGAAYIPQTANIFTTLSVADNLRAAGHLAGADLGQRVERAYDLFPELKDKRRSLGGALSGGQRQMLAFARALVMSPRLIMPDEPSAGLSPKLTAYVLERLRRLADSGVAVLMVEQNARAALQVSDRAYVLVEGIERLEAPARQLIGSAVLKSLYLGGAAAA